jgi:dihydrofolate reductase
MMVSFWPTPQAAKAFPTVAEGMNRSQKVVFSRTLDKASWQNTRVVKDGMAAEVRRMKGEPGQGMTILGSGQIVAQLASEGLIDEYQIVMNPIALGKGRTMFEGVKAPVNLKRVSTREFRNGNILTVYNA